MKILFVLNEIPYPPDNGVKIVSFNAIRLMHSAGHDVELAVLTGENDSNDERFQNLVSLFDFKMSWWMKLVDQNKLALILRSVIKLKLYFIERYKCLTFEKKLRLLIDNFKPDVVHFDLIPMTQYYRIVPVGIGKVASINDSYGLTLQNSLRFNDHPMYMRLIRRIQYYQTCCYEKKVYSKFDVTHVMSSADKKFLHNLNRNINICVISNGVDSSLFNVAKLTQGNKNIIFVAKLVGENLRVLEIFINKCWPMISQQCPGVEFHIVGKIGFEAQRLVDKLKNNEAIKFKGYADNLSEVYSAVGLAVVPINKNCGIINKAIEGMAAGLVVVGFNRSFTGILYARNNVHYLSSVSYEGIAQAIIGILHDDCRRKEVQSNAHMLAIKHYSWPSRIKDYELMYLSAKVCANNRV